MVKKNHNKELAIKANQQKAKQLLKTISVKTAAKEKLVNEIREADAQFRQLKKENMQLGGFAATQGMKPKRIPLAKVLQKIMKPGKKLTIAQIESAVVESGYDTSHNTWIRATIGARVRGMKGVHKVAHQRGMYVLQAPTKKSHKPVVHTDAAPQVA